MYKLPGLVVYIAKDVHISGGGSGHITDVVLLSPHIFFKNDKSGVP